MLIIIYIAHFVMDETTDVWRPTLQLVGIGADLANRNVTFSELLTYTFKRNSGFW